MSPTLYSFFYNFGNFENCSPKVLANAMNSMYQNKPINKQKQVLATWDRYPQKWFASRPPVIFREQDSDNGAQTTLS